MKSLKIAFIAVGIILLANITSNAQKIGYVDVEGVVGALPEAKDVSDKLDKFRSDSLGGAYTQMVKDYKEKDSISKLPATAASVKKVLENDLQQLSYNLQNWEQIAGNVFEGKKNALLGPLYKKTMDAVNAVAKEKGYAYILNPASLVVAPPGDDISVAVATRLGIKVPAQGGGAPSAPAATKPKPGGR